VAAVHALASEEWPTTAAELEDEQRRLAALWQHTALWEPPRDWRCRIGAVFVATLRGREGPGEAGETAWAASVGYLGGRKVDQAVVQGCLDAPYAAGLLALREGRLLERAVRALEALPDVLLVNASGRDHPRRAGLALHLGAVLDVPTIGVTDRPLVASGDDTLSLAGEVVAYRVRSARGARPVIVHAGWRVAAGTATHVLQRISSQGRTPEPLREARRLARTARSTG
jgi:deoxyribonuclease V